MGLSFGDPIPAGTEMEKHQAVKAAAALRLSQDSRGMVVQIVDKTTGKVFNVERMHNNPQVVLVTADATNGC